MDANLIGESMVINGKWNKNHFTISFKSNCTTFSLEENASTYVCSFDKTGRFWTGLTNGISYRRGLNGNIVAKWSSGKEILHRKWLNENEIKELLIPAHQKIRNLLQEIDNNHIDINSSIPYSGIEELQMISAFGWEKYIQEIFQYSQVYCPVGILPPDQYNAVVLQITEGCSFNTCTFCTFYKDRPFKIKNPKELEDHIYSVLSFIGDGMSLRRTIFLGDANALVVPMKHLIPMLETIHQKLDVEKLGGIFAFLDGFSGEKKNHNDYQALNKLGLKRIYIGMESGNNELLDLLKKPGNAQDVAAAVQDIKAGGLSVGIIILLGAGGKQFAHAHIQDTVKRINQMNLDADDLIYFSELIENEGMEYTQTAYQANLEPLTPEEREAQGRQIEAGLVFTDKGTPHISRYDIRDFIY
jgi:radical SAM superfamily enzyme YgiQ (UPF0313 family)